MQAPAEVLRSVVTAQSNLQACSAALLPWPSLYDGPLTTMGHSPMTLAVHACAGLEEQGACRDTACPSMLMPSHASIPTHCSIAAQELSACCASRCRCACAQDVRAGGGRESGQHGVAVTSPALSDFASKICELHSSGYAYGCPLAFARLPAASLLRISTQI